jgi:prepilin peptidase CpaA
MRFGHRGAGRNPPAVTGLGGVSVSVWLVLAACVVAVLTDLRTRRIPNVLTAALALAALALQATHGWAAFGAALAILALVLVLGSFAFGHHWLGGGDVKLLAAGAAALGFPDAVPFLIYTALGGGVLALVVAIARGRLVPVLRSVASMLRPFAYRGTVAAAPAHPIVLPYAVAIACGAVAVALSHTAAPYLKLPL